MSTSTRWYQHFLTSIWPDLLGISYLRVKRFLEIFSCGPQGVLMMMTFHIVNELNKISVTGVLWLLVVSRWLVRARERDISLTPAHQLTPPVCNVGYFPDIRPAHRPTARTWTTERAWAETEGPLQVYRSHFNSRNCHHSSPGLP